MSRVLRLIDGVEQSNPSIFLFCSGCSRDWHCILAVAEDGSFLGAHNATSHKWGWVDMQHESQTKQYEKKYPDGYSLEWVDNIDTHPGYQAMQARMRARKAGES